MKMCVFRIITILLCTGFTLVNPDFAAARKNHACSDASLRFAVISDLHFGSTRGDGAMVNVPRALKNILGKTHLDALVVVGDLTDNGMPEEYDMLLSVFNDPSIVPKKLPVHFLMGNHDNWNEHVDAEALFREKTKQPVNDFFTLKGYPFITIGQNGRGANDYNEQTRKFLSDKLEYSARKYPGKPIFVFVHVPVTNTCYGSAAKTGWGGNALTAILNGYPQAVVFSGHSHMPVGDPRSIHQGAFTSINDGCTTYTGTELDEVVSGVNPGNVENVTQGLIVNVKKNGDLEIERWDTKRNEEIAPRWLVEAPHDGGRFTYKNRSGLPAPAFADGAGVSVKTVGADSCVVVFPQARDNDVVLYYEAEILDGDKAVQTARRHSFFWLNSDMPTTTEMRFAGVPTDAPLTVRVVAVDSYGNRSTPITSAPFTIRSLPRFVVISDTHFENNVGLGAAVKVPRTLRNLLFKQPLPDAVFVVGDLTNRGKREQYEQLLSVFNDPTNVPESVSVYFMMGYQHDKSETNGPEVFLETVGQPLHRYVEIKGYPFVTISEGGRRETPHNIEARRFLGEKMAYAAERFPGKPIFVFMHIPPLNTCYGSGQNEGWGTDFFLPVLERYPQAIVFSGHSHFPLGDPRSIHQGAFTSVNDGSVSCSEVEPNVVDIGVNPENYEDITEGIIVNVLKNGDVEMERRDTYRDEEISPRWTVKAPHDGSRFVYKNRNGLPAPVFAEGARPVVTTAGDDELLVTFPQARDNDVVHHYSVEILDGKRTIASRRIFSQFYLNSAAPAELSAKFTGIPLRKRLAINVTAVDSYGNRSTQIVTNHE